MATVIVALPPVDDYVNKISSEDVAHLTVLFLGEAQLSMEAVLYIEHACKELSPFGMSVEHRGPLGPDEADVLFFEKNPWDFKRIAEFRHYLLLNDEIKRAYESADQFPEWTPHLTLGYPESPAHELDEDRRIRYVDFDRISVWMEESEGPTFRLKYDDFNTMGDVAMSDTTTAARGAAAVAELFHYGVKGMKWGVTTVDKAAQPTLTREKDMRVAKSSNVTVTQRKAGHYAKASGGKRLKATDDAVKAVAARQKAKKSTTDALTNAELKAAVDRMQLEQQYAKLNKQTVRRGKGFVALLFSNPEARERNTDLLKRVAEANAS